jgi:hypothetical protein
VKVSLDALLEGLVFRDLGFAPKETLEKTRASICSAIEDREAAKKRHLRNAETSF